MTLRGSLRPLQPDLDRFLLATVGDEMSVISAFTRLGLDPWQEAGRLSPLSNREAIEQLALLIAELPGLFRPRGEAREIANRSSNFSRDTTPTVSLPRKSEFAPVTSDRSCRGHPNSGWVAGLVFAAAVLVSAFPHGGFQFEIGGP